MNRRTLAWLLLGVGLGATVLGGVQVFQLATAPAQPWSPLLRDNVVFALSLPFLVGLGIVLGTVQALLTLGHRAERRPGQIRRFAPSTVLLHWTNAVGFLIALGTGGIQYLTGVLDKPPPAPLWVIYRLHYIGASIMVLVATTFVTARLLTADYRLLPPRGSWIRHLRGLVAELPTPLGNAVVWALGLRRGRAAPPVGQFTYYEKTVDFPLWTLLLAAILLTGALKAMRYLYPLPGAVVHVASVIHVATMVLLTLKLLDHLRYMLAPSRWPLLRAMVTTWVAEQHVREHHPAWYAEVAAAQQVGPAPPAPPEGVAPGAAQQQRA
jgi:cytochrome b subunit of formate dehydrogenase